MKILKTVVLTILSLLYANDGLQAHGGRTNSEGCHNNRKTGDYHCHNTGSKPSQSYQIKQDYSQARPAVNTSKYNRKSWPHWTDEDNDCQNTRAEILIRDSLGQVKFKRNKGCSVSWGRWIGPYTGEEFTKASDLDIDHIVPLSHAHKTGASNWTRKEKRRFANDPENLLAVDDSTNQAKGDKGPARWKPPLKSYWCEYANRWKRIKIKYGLNSSIPEQRSLGVMGRECH
jgi:hypothetical protein